MIIAKIVGNIISNYKLKELNGSKLFLVQLLDSNLKETDKFLVAVDSVGVGLLDIVLVATGGAARKTEVTKDMPIGAAIVARFDKEN